MALKIGIVVSVPSALSPEPRTPVSPHATLILPTIHPPSTKAQGKWLQMRIVPWPFRRVPVSLANFHFSLGDEIHLISTARCYVAPLPDLVLWVGEPGVWWRSQASRGDLCSRDIPLEAQPLLVGAGPALFVSHRSYQA